MSDRDYYWDTTQDTQVVTGQQCSGEQDSLVQVSHDGHCAQAWNNNI